jgi:hypothetical protein
MLSIAEATMLVFELHIRQLVGVAQLRRLIDDWIARNIPASTRIGVAARRAFVIP